MGLKFLYVFFVAVLAVTLCTSSIISITAKEYDIAITVTLQLVFLSVGFVAGYSLAQIFSTTIQKNQSKSISTNANDE